MKELFVISSYLSTKVQENQLRNLVSKLKQNNKDVLVVSHTHVPSDIVELCDYYFYDKDNCLVPNYKTDIRLEYKEPNKIYSFTKFGVFCYWNISVASLKTHYHGLFLAKELEYDICHFLIYDTDFDSLAEFNDNNFLLKTYDVVYYALSNNSNLPAGFISSFNLNKYSIDEFRFDKKALIKSQITPPNPSCLPNRQGHMAETLLYENLIFPKNGFKKFLDLRDKKLRVNLSDDIDNKPTSTKLVLNCVVVDSSLEAHWLVYDSRVKIPTSLDLSLSINNSNTINLKSKSNVRHLYNIGSFNKVNNLKFYLSGELIEEIDFTKIDKDFYKDNSIINFL